MLIKAKVVPNSGLQLLKTKKIPARNWSLERLRPLALSQSHLYKDQVKVKKKDKKIMQTQKKN